jgi:hypothetical protein
MDHCPFCEHELREGASSCGKCFAEKGYSRVRGMVYGRSLTIAFGIIFPSAFALFFLWRWATYGGPLSIAVFF